MHLGPRNPNGLYSIDNVSLSSENVIRDLGINYDSNLCFSSYIDKIVSKAYQRVNLIFRTFFSRDHKILTLAYTTYVRPLLEYCTSVWSPYLINDITRVENVQRYFTRRLFFKKGFSYTERLFLLELESPVAVLGVGREGRGLPSFQICSDWPSQEKLAFPGKLGKN